MSRGHPSELKRTLRSPQLIAGAGQDHDAGAHVQHELTINILLEEALNEPDIGTTSRFRWHATAVGIAALWIDSARHQHRPLRTHSKKGSMLGSTSAERNENFIKWSRGWFCCFIRKNNTGTPPKKPNKYIRNQNKLTKTIYSLF